MLNGSMRVDLKGVIEKESTGGVRDGGRGLLPDHTILLYPLVE